MDCITTIFNTLTSGMSPVSLSFQPFIFSFLLLYPKLVSSPRWAAAGEVFLSAGSADAPRQQDLLVWEDRHSFGCPAADTQPGRQVWQLSPKSKPHPRAGLHFRHDYSCWKPNPWWICFSCFQTQLSIQKWGVVLVWGSCFVVCSTEA